MFILLGQSNMLGFGRIGPEDKKGTLTYLTKEEKKYPHLVDDQGNWTQRRDVRYVQVMHRGDKMSTLRNEWLTVKGKHIGPELQFGHIMGHVLDEPVLVLKTCIGNRSLGWDLLPPGSKQFEFEGKIYAGYKESPLSWAKGTKPKPIAWYAGKQYDDDIGNAWYLAFNSGAITRRIPVIGNSRSCGRCTREALRIVRICSASVVSRPPLPILFSGNMKWPPRITHDWYHFSLT